MAVLLAGTLVGLEGSLAPAVAQCADNGKHVYTFTGTNSVSWIGTDVSSIWLAGPGRISYTETATATTTASVSVSVSVGVSVLIASAKSQFGYALTTGSSYSSSWQYSIPVPAGVTARARVYKKGWQLEINDRRYQADCTLVHVQYLYLYGPLSGNGAANYCIARDSYPGKDVLNNGCVAH